MIQKTEILVDHSVVKTERSYIDNMSHKEPKQMGDHNDRIEQFRYVCQWINKKLHTFSVSHEQQMKKEHTLYNYYLIKIDSINNLTFKRVYPLSKVYIQLVCKLVNLKWQKQYIKTCRIVRQLTEVNAYLFQLKEPLCFYCYTSSEADIIFKIEILLSEQEKREQSTVLTYGHAQNLGFVEIDLLKEKKNKQKKSIASPNEYSSMSRFTNETNASNAFVYYYLHKSDSYRYLEKIIPENVICDPSDRIPGIVGYYLPLSQNTLTEFSITPEAKGLLLNFINIQFTENIIKDALTKAQMLTRQKHSLLNKLNINLGQITLTSFFHNGWKIVSHGETIIKQRGEINMKTNHSHFTQFQNPKKVKQQGVHAHKRKNINKVKHFSSQNSVQLKLSFPQEEYCALIIQICINLHVKFQIQDKKQGNTLTNEQLSMPLCFAISSAKSLANFRVINAPLYSGSCMNSFYNLRDMVLKSVKQIRDYHNKKRNTTESMFRTKNPSIVLDIQQFQNLREVLKTHDNISQISISKAIDKDQFGFIELQIQFVQSQEIGKFMEANNSLLLQNFSSVNVSKIDVKDKIHHEKERILRETKKIIAQKNKKIGIQFIKEIFISDHLKYQSTDNKGKMKGGLLLHKKQEILNLFKEQLKKSNYKHNIERLLDYKKGGLADHKHILAQNLKKMPEMDSLSLKEEKFCKLYMIQLNKNYIVSDYLHESMTKYLFLLYSNYNFYSDSYYKYEQIPQEIIKTELSQINFNNCYFFHFLQLNNINNKMIKFPKIFFFVIKFYNEKEVRSELMTVNKDTGQIFAFQSSKQNEKIVHIEIDVDRQADNYALNYIHFIEYLYNGLLNIEIIDYSTSLLYGKFSIPLRNLIRKRKNEVIIYFQDYIYHRNKVKASMKVQMRAIRKMKNKPKLQINASLKPLMPNQVNPNQSNKNFPEFKQIKSKPLANSKEQANKGKNIKEMEVNKEEVKFEKEKMQNESDRRLQRINKFKQNKYKKQSKSKYDNKPFPIQQQILGNFLNQDILTQQQQSAKITRLLQHKYFEDIKIMKVSYLKKQFIFLQIENKYQTHQDFSLLLNDQDQKWLSFNNIKISKEITVIKDLNLLEKQDVNILNSVKKYQEMMMKCLPFDQEERIHLAARAKGHVLLCYQSLRKYRQSTTEAQNNQGQNGRYNRQRIITCSLTNQVTGNIQSIYSISIMPMPQESTIELQYYRPAFQQSVVHIPFIDPHQIISQTDHLLSNNPYLIVSPANQSAQDNVLTKFSFISNSGIYIQIPNTLDYQEQLKFDILVFNNTKEKKKNVMQERKNSRLKLKTRNVVNSSLEMHQDLANVYGPQTISLQIKVWGCEKISLKGELWIEKQGIIELRKNIFKKSNKSLQLFYLISDDEQCLKLHKNDKSKHQGQQVYRFNDNQSKIDLHYTLCSQQIGSYYIYINAIDAQQVSQQKTLLATQLFREIQPFHRLVVFVQNQIPGFKEILKININKSSQQLTIQEPFIYKSSLNKKMNFKILTNDENIMWVKSNEVNFTLQGKAEKKFTINVNIQNILQRNLINGCSSVILGVKWAKGIDYFGFKFNIY